MTPFASVAVFRREGKLTFKPPRKEPHENVTQARKSAARFWRGNIAEPDKLAKVVLVQVSGSTVQIAERAANAGHDRPWLVYHRQVQEAFGEAHIAACLAELGVDPQVAPAAMPDILEINGVIYRREI
jgi:hypothetical protein